MNSLIIGIGLATLLYALNDNKLSSNTMNDIKSGVPLVGDNQFSETSELRLPYSETSSPLQNYYRKSESDMSETSEMPSTTSLSGGKYNESHYTYAF
jgi:hypothetical protein